MTGSRSFMDQDFMLKNDTAKHLFTTIRKISLSSIITVTSLPKRSMKTEDLIILRKYGSAERTLTEPLPEIIINGV